MSRNVPVSVLIPAYNAARFLPAALETIRAQTAHVDEIIVVDDESTDDTASVAQRLGARVLRQRRGGPAGARNAGLAVARNEWIATLDADDVWHPRKLELQLDALRAAPGIGLIFTDFDAVSVADGNIHRRSVVSDHPAFQKLGRNAVTPQAELLDEAGFLRELPARSIILPSTAVFKRDLAIEIGGFTTEVKAEDTEFFLRLASRTRIAFVDVPLTAYMRHASQITANWELDPVRLELFQYVMAHKSRYDDLIVDGFREQQANALYYCAANAASKRRLLDAAAFLSQAVAVAGWRGQLTTLSRTVGQSRIVRSRLGRPAADSASMPTLGIDDAIVRDVEIPWRRSAHGCKLSA